MTTRGIGFSLFPAQISDCDYYHAVLDHVFKPMKEDHHDASGWIQDVESLVAYLDNHDDSVSRKFCKFLANESKLTKIRNFIHIVQGSGKDVSQILAAIDKVKSTYENKKKSFADDTKTNIVLKSEEFNECQMQRQPVLIKDNDHLICSPLFLYDSAGVFVKALEDQMKGHSWKNVSKDHNSPPFLEREDAETLVKANIKLAPAHLHNLRCVLEGKLIDILEKINPLQLALLQGDLKKIDDLVKVPEHRTSALPITTLGFAILSGNLDAVKALVNSSNFDLDEKCHETFFSTVQIAAATGNLPILRFLLEKGAKPVFSKSTDHWLKTKLLLEKGAQIPVNPLLIHRSMNTLTSRRLQRLFKDSISRSVISEVNERLNIRFLSHAWNKNGMMELKRRDQGASSNVKLEGSYAQVNCEMMCIMWKEFCRSHPQDIPRDFETFLGDALKCAAESNILKAEGLFERYQKGHPTIIPVRFNYDDETSHCVGVFLLNDYVCVFNGGIGKRNGAIFHGKFKPDLMTAKIIKMMMKRKDLVKYEKFFYKELPKTIGLKIDKDNIYLKMLADWFGLTAQDVGNCGWFNINHLVPVVLSQYLYNNRDKSKQDTRITYWEALEAEEIVNKAYIFSDEWYKFQQAWLLRNYLLSDTRQEYDLGRDFITNILQSSWDLWLKDYSQVTKNILYESEKRFLNLVSEEDRSIYKADKVMYLIKAWEGRTLFPFKLSDDPKKNRLR